MATQKKSLRWYLMAPLMAVRVLRAYAAARRAEQTGPLPVWVDDAAFRASWETVKAHTLLDPVGMYLLYQWAQHCCSLPGEAAEAGVYQGGSARLLGEVFQPLGKTLHLFDTFAGMPATDAEKDWHQQGDFADTSLSEVQAFLANAGNAAFHPGFFPATAIGLEEASFCFVHVDMDIYQSVWDCCAFFYPRLTIGGAMIFDDYGHRTCPGAKQAVDRFFSDTPENPVYLPTGQCVVVKT